MSSASLRVPVRSFAGLALLAGVAVGAMAPNDVLATSFNYTGALGGMFGVNFNNAGNWSPGGGPPGAGDTGTIAKGDVIVLTADTGTINTLNIRGGASVFTGANVLDVTGGANGFAEVVDDSILVVQPDSLFSFVTDTLSLRLGGELRMAGGSAVATFVVRGSTTSLISGHGSVGLTATSGTGLDMAGTIQPNGGDLTIIASQGAKLDLDGNSAGADLGGTLDVIYDGDLFLHGALADPFSGRMDIGNNNRVQLNVPFLIDGQVNITSGTTSRLVAPSVVFQTGADVTVQAADGQIEGTTTFNSGTTVFLLNAADDLRLQGDSTISSGVQFSGAGAVQIAGGGRMTLLDGANVGVRLFNTGAGELRIGSSAGDATVAGYQQSASSDLRIELGGVGLEQFDRLAITGNATLGGELAVSMLSGFTLSAGRSFEILDIGGTRTGLFAGLVEGAKVGTFGKDLFITYAGGDGNDVALFTKGFSADFDGDNDVDGADFLTWQSHRGLQAAATASQGDADGDKDVDYDDYLAWRGQFGSKAAAEAAVSAVPEPATSWLLLVAGIAAGRWRRERPTSYSSA